MPIRLRLTIAAIAGLILVVSGLSWFVYVRVGDDLLDTVDAGLRSRSEVLASGLRSGGPSLPHLRATLIETDEGFAQISDGTGALVDSSRVVEDSTLVPPDQLAGLGGPTLLDEHVPGIDNVTRVLATPLTLKGNRFVLLVGASLQDRRDEMLQLASTLAIAGVALIVVLGIGAWWLIGAMMERVEASTRHERELIDRASHELRTPLALQRVGLDLALTGPQTPEELRAGLEEASEENEHLVRIADDLLVLARGREGRLAVHRRDVSLRQMLTAIARRHREDLARSSVGLSTHASDVRVHVDPDWVRQAVDDLLDNAIRSTPAGGRVRLLGTLQDGRVRIDVEDTGPGFDPSILAQAFDPFRSGDGSDGAGLGLAIVRAIAEAHGGTAKAENTLEGARVTMSMPAAP